MSAMKAGFQIAECSLFFFICILLDKVRFSITKPFVNYIVGKWKLK